eukprot:jgi/Orpsp1_1/1188966/evm.model.d7180000068584.2
MIENSDIISDVVSIIKNEDNPFILINYCKKNEIKISSLNNKEIDFLIYAIENCSSLSVIKYLLKFYQNINYEFSPTIPTSNSSKSLQNYYYYNNEEYILSLNYNGVKVPLFSAIALKAYDIADFLIKHHANINYTIEKDGKTLNIINYLCSIGSYYCNEESLKYILSRGFDINNLTPSVFYDINNMEWKVNRSYIFSNIILKQYMYDHHFILNMILMGKNRDSLSDENLNKFLENEKRKFSLQEDHYDAIIDNCFCKGILQFLLYLDEPKTKFYLGKKTKYDILYHALKADKSEYFFSDFLSDYVLTKKFNSFDCIEDLIVNICERGYNEILKFIFEILFSHPKYGISRNSIDFKKIILIFSECGNYNDIKGIETIKVLVEALLNVNFEKNDFTNIDLSLLKKFKGRYLTLALHMVMKTENIDLLKIFYPKLLSLSPKFNINSFDINNKYPIVTAFYDNGYIFEYIFKLGVNYEINWKINSLSLFTCAMDTDRYIQAKCLLQKNIIIGEDDITNSSLMWSVYCDDLNEVKELILHTNKKRKLDSDNNNDENISGNSYKTVYFSPIEDLVKLRNERSRCGFTPLILSYILEYKEMFEFLLKYVNINELDDRDNRNSILLYAVLKEDIPTIKKLIQMGADVNYQEWLFPNYFLLDIVLLFLRNMEIYNLLLESPNINLNLTNEAGKTHFMTMLESKILTDNEKETIAKLLLEKGYDINIINSKDGGTAINYAVAIKSLSIVKLLVEHGANININNQSPLCLAYSSPELFQYLLEHGADVNNKEGESPFQNVYNYGKLNLVEQLLKRNIDLNYRVKIEYPSFFNTLNTFEDNEIPSLELETIFTKSINSDYHNFNDESIVQKRKIIIKYIVQNYPQIFTDTVVKEMIYFDRLDVLKILLRYHFELMDKKDENGDTPIVHAFRYKRKEIINYLLRCGANINNINNNGINIDHILKNYNNISYIKNKLNHYIHMNG